MIGINNETEGEKNVKICASCNKVVKGQFVRALGGIYHLNCFRCMDCNEVCIKKFFPHKENGVTIPLCETDYFKRLDLICAKCGCALRGPHINALNKKYHLNHFTCTVCDVVFQPNASYYEHDGKIYCETHYSKLFAQCCGGCHTPVLRQLIEVNKDTDSEEQWHPECYMIYKTWNVKLELENEISKDSNESIDLDEKQKLVEEKINRIWTILSAFEESSAECITEILSCISDNLYLNGIDHAYNLICHIEVLFSGIDEIETKLKKFNDKTGLQPTEEPKLLAKKIINFFSFSLLKRNNSSINNNSSSSSSTSDTNRGLKNKVREVFHLPYKEEQKRSTKKIGNLLSLFSHKKSISSRNTNKKVLFSHKKSISNQDTNKKSPFDHKNNSISYTEMTQEFLDLVKTLAHILKVLIRFALKGALKLEKTYNDKTAIDSFLNKFLTLGEMQSEFRQLLMTSNEYNIKSEYCPICHKPVEEECIKLNDSRWHSSCFYCQICKKNLYETYNEKARMDQTDKKLYCKKCSPPNTVDGFVRVTQLQQYIFLLKFALKRLYEINNKE